MWSGLSQFTNALKEQAESVVRESGLDGQLQQARKAAAGLLLDVPAAEKLEDTEAYQSSPRAPISHFAEYAFAAQSASDPGSKQNSEAEVEWHGLDSGGFSDVPLGSPPQRTSQSLSQSNGVKPRLDQVAQSLGNLEGASAAANGNRADQLLADNARLQERLRAVENEAVEVLGELEELKDKSSASESARLAAERQAKESAARCSALEAEAQQCGSLAKAREKELQASAEAAAEARRQLEDERESFEKRIAQGEAEKKKLAQQLQELQLSAIPSPVKQVVADGESAEQAPAVDDVKDLKAKLAKIKRQAISFKTKFTEAAVARDAALAELEVLKQENGDVQKATASTQDTEPARQQLEHIQEQLREAVSHCQELEDQLHQSEASYAALTSQNAELASQVRLKDELQKQQEEIAEHARSVQQQESELQSQLQTLAEAHSAAEGRAERVDKLAGQLAADLEGVREERQALEASLQQHKTDLTASMAELESLKAQHGVVTQDMADRLEAAAAKLQSAEAERSALLSELAEAQHALASAARPAETHMQNAGDGHAAGERHNSVASEGAMQSNPLFSPAKGGSRQAIKAESTMMGAASEVTALKQEAARAAAERDELTKQLTMAREEARSRTAGVEEAGRELAALREGAVAAAPNRGGVTCLEGKLKAAEARASELAEQLDAKQKQSEASQAKLQELEAALSAAREQLLAESAASAEARATADSAGQEREAAQVEVAGLREALEQAQAAAAASEQASQALQSRLASAQEEVSRLQEALGLKEEQLEAVRGGSAVESNLAASAIKEANERAQGAQQAVAAAEERASQAEQRAEGSAANARSEIDAANSRRQQAEAALESLQAQLGQAQGEAQVLREALEAERSAAAADVASLRHSFEQESRAACSRAREEVERQFQKRLQEQAAQSDVLLAEKSSALERAEAEVERLKKAMSEAGTAAQALAETTARTEGLERELEQTRKQLTEATGQLQEVRQQAEEAQAGAKERQKKFSMLNATFRKKEEGLLARAEEAEAAASQLRAEVSAASHRAALAEQEAQRLALAAEEHAGRLAAAEAACAAADRGREAAQKAAAVAAAQLVAAEAQLAAAHAARSLAAADAESFEERVQAAVTVREEEAAQRVREAEEERAEAQRQVARAEARAAAAEAAKIELSLKLAEALSSQESIADVSAVPTAVANPRLATGSPEEWAARTEELELAAKVASRRAATAEAELHRVRQQLEAADKRAKELAWQIKMISDPRQIGGQQTAGSGTPAGVTGAVLDMFGCGANYRR